MSDVTPAAADAHPAPPLGILASVVDASRRLTKAQQATILTLVVLVAATTVTVQFVTKDTPPLLIVLIGLLCGTVPLITHGGKGLASAVAIFGFTLAAIFMLRPEAEPRPGQAGVAPAPVARDEVDQTPVRLAGHVYDARSRRFVPGALVSVMGHGATMDSTDSMGGFELSVPKHILRKDSVSFIVRTEVDTVFRKAVAEAPFELHVRSAGRLASGDPRRPDAARLGSAAVMRAAAPARRTPPAGGGLRVVVDSIRTISAGPGEPHRWSFEIDVNDGGDYTIPPAEYSGTPGRQWMLVGGERSFPVPERGVVELAVQGSRRVNFYSSHDVRGSIRVGLDGLRSDTPARVAVDVVNARDPAHGRFVFHLTLIREGTGTGALQQRRVPLRRRGRGE